MEQRVLFAANFLSPTPNPGVLTVLRDAALACSGCELAKNRTNVVFGHGNTLNPVVAFVGEAPGANEDRVGQPFVGKAGELLNRMIEAMKLSRPDTYIANTVCCLRYNAPVQLENGSWERIGRLVTQKYSGKVLSIDSEDRIVAKRVTDWHATPLGERRVFRLSYASSGGAGCHRSGMNLTGDHEVLTRNGYIPVERLTPQDALAVGQGLSRVAKSVLTGTLLGDASIATKSASVTMTHCAAQQDRKSVV